MSRTLVSILLMSLACVAVPARAGTPDDELAAAQVTAALNVSAGAKVAVAERYLETGQWPDSNAAVGNTSPGDGPADIAIGAGGVVTITFDSPESLRGKTIALAPSASVEGHVSWSCSSSGIAESLLPEPCR